MNNKLRWGLAITAFFLGTVFLTILGYDSYTFGLSLNRFIGIAALFILLVSLVSFGLIYDLNVRKIFEERSLVNILKINFALSSFLIALYTLVHSSYSGIFIDNGHYSFRPPKECNSAPSQVNISKLIKKYTKIEKGTSSQNENYHFLFVLDNTLTTQKTGKTTRFNKADVYSRNLLNLLSKSNEEIKKSFFNQNGVQKFPEIKEALFLCFLETLRKNYPGHKFSTCLMGNGSPFITNWLQIEESPERWINVGSLNSLNNFKTVIKEINSLDQNLSPSIDTTDFNIVLKGINEEYKSLISDSKKNILIVTIFSDFLNDDYVELEFLKRQIQKLTGTLEVRMNLISVPYNIKHSTSSIPAEKSISVFKNYFKPSNIKLLNSYEFCLNSYEINNSGNGITFGNSDLNFYINEILAPSILTEEDALEFYYKNNSFIEGTSIIEIKNEDDARRDFSLSLKQLDDRNGYRYSNFTIQKSNEKKLNTLFFEVPSIHTLNTGENLIINYKDPLNTIPPKLMLTIFPKGSKRSFAIPVRYKKGLPCTSLYLLNSFWLLSIICLSLSLISLIILIFKKYSSI